jgi:uncharacterized protein YndB with AHSA1/START domain
MISMPNSVRVSRTICASADRLFDAWTDPQKLMHWWRQATEGWAFAAASIDLRVGGRYRLAMTAPDGKLHAAVGEYRQIERPIRLIFTWDWEEPANSVGDTLVSVEFKDAGRNRTEVVVTHERFADPARMGRHEQGWTDLLALLERAIA